MSTSTKPYLLRAIYQWAEDNGFTPQVLVNASKEGVLVPEGHVVDGQIVLNVSATAVAMETMDNDCLQFSARFSGVEQHIYLPMTSILAIYARENSQGIYFDEEPDVDDQPSQTEQQASPASDVSKNNNTKKDAKRSASHLKIIK